MGKQSKQGMKVYKDLTDFISNLNQCRVRCLVGGYGSMVPQIYGMDGWTDLQKITGNFGFLLANGFGLLFDI